jgi:DNA-directed RNA polymerase subunit RPC12/RpoP
MSRYPRAARNAAIKCIACNAPVTETVDNEYVCVECGSAPIQKRVQETMSPQAADD